MKTECKNEKEHIVKPARGKTMHRTVKQVYRGTIIDNSLQKSTTCLQQVFKQVI